MRLPFLLALAAIFSSTTLAFSDTIYASSAYYCSSSRNIQLKSFDISYHKQNQSLTYAFSITSASQISVNARIYGQAYGIVITNTTVDICSLLDGALCPLPVTNFTGYGTYQVPDSVANDIPGIAWNVPNLDAFARIELLDSSSGAVELCVQANLSNGLSAYQLGVVIASGIFCLLAVLAALFHAGLVNSPSPAQYRWFDVIFVFQTAAATGMLHLNYPQVYLAFTENFHWIMGLFYNKNVNSSINSMRARTGGYLSNSPYSGTQYISGGPTSTDGAININNLIQAIQSLGSLGLFSFKRSITKRDPSIIVTDTSGIPDYVNALGIPTANAFDTIFFWFLAFLAMAIAFHVIVFLVVWICDRGHQSWARRLRKSWWGYCGGNALRLCLLWFFPVWIFGFYQFKIRDSGLSIFFAVLSMVLTFVPLLVVFILALLRARRPSSTAPNISPLYTSYRWFHSAGAVYRPYRQRFHWFWFAPLVLAIIARSGFIAFGNGWSQVIGCVVVELLVLVFMLAFRPHKDRKGDWLGGFLSFARLVAFGLLIAFIPSLGVAAITRTIIGFVIIVVFGIQVILLFVGMIWNIGYGYWWRKHNYKVEDGLEVERFAATKDENDNVNGKTGMRTVDANKFVSGNHNEGYGAYEAGGVATNAGADPRLTRRSSVIEPVGRGNTYEPSEGYSTRPGSGLYDTPMSPASTHHGYGYGIGGEGGNTRPASMEAAYAYEQAANGGRTSYHQDQRSVRSIRNSGYAGNGGNVPPSPTGSGRNMAPPISRRSTGGTGNSVYYTPGNVGSPQEDRSWNRDQYFNRDGRY